MTKTIQFNAAPNRILVIKPSAIGDVVHALPALNLLRRRWPAARIAWLVAAECAGILQGHPQIDELILFNRNTRGIRKTGEALAGAVGLARAIRQRRFDVVVDLQGLFRSGFFTAMSGAAVRIGFSDAREGAVYSYTHTVKANRLLDNAVDRYLAVVSALGCGREPVEFVFADPSVHAPVAAQTPAKYAVLLPGTNWVTKRWPAERFAELVRPLRERLGLSVIIAGAGGDKPLALEILGKLKGENAVDLTGQTTLGQLIALLRQADLVIANDSGPMHIAAALCRPLVAIYGPTHPVATGPWGRLDSVIRLDLPCSPCYSRHCTHQSCMKWLDASKIVELAEKQLRRYG